MNLDLGRVIEALLDEDVRFVIVGGIAMTLHGSAYITYDLDIAVEKTAENARRIASALAPFSPRPRGFPNDLPFIFDAQTLHSSQILTLETTAGSVDVLGEISGVGPFSTIDTRAESLPFRGRAVRVLSIDALIESKRAANRSKDEPGLIELEALKEARAFRDAEAKHLVSEPSCEQREQDRKD